MNLRAFVIPMMVLSLSACEALKMPKTTKEMNTTTQQMSANMEETLVKMDETHQTMLEMQQETADMICQGRSNKAQESRDRNFIRIQQARNFEEKLYHAAVFYKGFEFQLWRKTSHECLDRSEFQTYAVKELFKKTAKLFARVDVKDLTPAEAQVNSDVMSLMALSVGMHEIHKFQKSLLKKDPKLAKVSMLSMIKDALAKKDALEKEIISTDELTESEAEIIDAEDRAIALLKMRQNYLAAAVLQKVSDIATADEEEAGMMAQQPWDSKFSELNPVQQEKAIKYVAESIRTKDFLKEHNISHEYDFATKLVLKNLRVKNCEGDNCGQGKMRNALIFTQLVGGLVEGKSYNEVMQSVALELAKQKEKEMETEREPDDSDE